MVIQLEVRETMSNWQKSFFNRSIYRYSFKSVDTAIIRSGTESMVMVNRSWLYNLLVVAMIPCPRHGIYQSIYSQALFCGCRHSFQCQLRCISDEVSVPVPWYLMLTTWKRTPRSTILGDSSLCSSFEINCQVFKSKIGLLEIVLSRLVLSIRLNCSLL